MTYETILIEKQGPVDWVTLNRPERLNAITTRMATELRHYFGGLFEKAFLEKRRPVYANG